MPFDPNGHLPRGLLTLVAAITGIAPFIADWNETHIYNPDWPGHAKFHNGQTMSMGACLALCTLWKTYWDNSDHLLTACVFASMYYITMLSACYYPDVTGFDPPEHFSYSFPQAFIALPILALVGLAYWLERMRVGGLKRKAA